MPDKKTKPDTSRFTPSNIADIKANLSLRETVERLTGIRFDSSGGRLKACCPFHQERTPSFFIDEDAGRYKCFGSGCGKSGDVIQFIADWHSVGFKEALSMASEYAGLPMEDEANTFEHTFHVQDRKVWNNIIPRVSKPIQQKPRIRELTPIPEDINLPNSGNTVFVQDDVKNKKLRVNTSHVHVYRRPDGKPLCLVLRASKSDGGKFFIQARWDAETNDSWKLLRFGSKFKRPVYGLQDNIKWSENNGQNILIVEGETTRDAAASLLPPTLGWLALTHMGGSNAVKLANWQPLTHILNKRRLSDNSKFSCHIWPDADSIRINHQEQEIDPQQNYYQAVKESIRSTFQNYPQMDKHVQFHHVKSPKNVPNGWDIADALKERWTTERLLDHISEFNPVNKDNQQVEIPSTDPNSH